MSREPAGIRRAVCPGCPFRGSGKGARIGANLTPERRAEIRAALEAGESFVCHAEQYGDEAAGPAGPRQCTGAAVLLARTGTPNLVMRVAVAFGEPPFVDPGERVIPWPSVAAWAE